MRYIFRKPHSHHTKNSFSFLTWNEVDQISRCLLFLPRRLCFYWFYGVGSLAWPENETTFSSLSVTASGLVTVMSQRGSAQLHAGEHSTHYFQVNSHMRKRKYSLSPATTHSWHCCGFRINNYILKGKMWRYERGRVCVCVLSMMAAVRMINASHVCLHCMSYVFAEC